MYVISESTGVLSGFDLMLFIADRTAKWLCNLTEGCRGARCCAKLRMSLVQTCGLHAQKADEAGGNGDAH